MSTIFVRVGYCCVLIGMLYIICVVVCFLQAIVAGEGKIFGKYNLCTYWLLPCVNWN